MQNFKIGVFDSGLGGLTAVRELIKILPNEDIIYFGDTGRVPYGTRSHETIKHYAAQDISFLKTHDLKAIVVACGTVSSVALEYLMKHETLPIIGVVEPTCKMAAKSTKNGKIGVIGTAGTIKSSSYEKVLHDINPEIHVVSASCPLFVPLVENGRFKRGDKVSEIVVEEYLQKFRDENVDCLILGCTHYPLLSDIISDFLGEDVKLIDSGAEAAKRLRTVLLENNSLNKKGKKGELSFYVSDGPENFENFGGMFLGQNINNEVTQIDITKF